MSAGSVPRLVDELLAEQQAPAAVDLFSEAHDAGRFADPGGPREARIPIGRVPLPGQQLAFRVDLDACTGCKACVTACHSLNGLAPEETWRDVGLLVGEGGGAGFQQTVTTACHHCEDPACLAGCPVRAYEKDPVTGIVRHLDDQCIGCQYCLLTCLYDVPRFHAELGIVRKCDMCTGRLEEGEAPACVQGCPNGAITIDIVEVGAAPDLLLPGVVGVPDSSVTRPTTRYVSAREVQPLQPAVADLVPAPPHDPLAAMLVGMQLSVGTLAFEVALGLGPLALALAAASGLAGLGAATLHLGRPQYAFRSFLGWRTSWMSREILAFGAYAPAVAAAAALAGLPRVAEVPTWLAPWAPRAASVLAAVALAIGIVGTACSAMIYVGTQRRAWSMGRTAGRFAGSALGLGALGGAWCLALGGSGTAMAAALLVTGGSGLAVKAFLERREARTEPADAVLARTVRLLRGPLAPRLRVRGVCAAGALGLACAGAAAAAAGALHVVAFAAGAALVAAALGELVERHLFFTSEAQPGMPGG